jgi:MFS family permease
VSAPDNFRITAAVVASALLMQGIDGTIVVTALPSMAHSLGVNPVHMSSAITSYLVALTVFIPISGWVADRCGAKRVFMAAIAVFTLSSALCALSHGLAQLLAARILQGAGGAMMVPVGRLMLLRRVRREELLSATTWLTMPALLGPVLGPPLGGLSRSLSFASMGALAFADVPRERLSAATSFQGTAQQSMKAVGVAIAAGSMQLTIAWSGRSHASHRDFVWAFLATALVVLASWPLFAALPAGAGAGISRGKRHG